MAKSKQLVIPQAVAVAKEINGIEMGILDDGMPYLSGRGVARLCGVVASAIIGQSQAWSAGKRDSRFAQKMIEEGYAGEHLFIPIKAKGGDTNAYPEEVCMAFLDYYAFEAQTSSPTARLNLRKLARGGLRLFVYSALGYDPRDQVPSAWRQFHDRTLLATVPAGYFSIFKEAAELVITSIRCGLPCDEHTVPDISVGVTWGKHWADNDLDITCGARIKHEHNYPDYFPQAASNPQDVWVYPVGALGAFRIWLQKEYLPEKFPRYLEGKMRKGVLAASSVELLIAQTPPPPELTG